MERRKLNAVGPAIRRIRNEKGWSQPEFATRAQVGGWDIDRVIISKIESGLRAVTDIELFYLAKILGTTIPELFPRDRAMKKEHLPTLARPPKRRAPERKGS